MAQTSLPPGFRFHPTDIELCAYYLKRKIMGKKLIVDAIAEVELYKFAPWDLPDKSCLRSRDLEWFFFCPRDKKYPNGSRTNRATPNGYWKTSGKDRTIMLESRMVGSKKTLIFHQGKAPKGDRTDWVMYEYKMEDDSLVSAGFSKDAYVLCKIFKKSGLGPRIGEQYGAPFNEAEWENAENETSMFHLMPSSEVVNPVEDPHAQQAVAAGTMEELIGEHPSAVCAMDESSFGTAANTCVEDMTFNNAVAGSDIQEGMVSENIVSNEVHNLYDPPEFDGFLLEELSNFLNDSPLRDNAFVENPVLPPMSDAEAHAFEVNTLDLYNELAAISGLGDVPSNFNTGLGDVPSNFNTSFADVPSNFNTGYDGTMGHITLPADRYLSTDEFLELNDIVDPEFDAEFPAQNSQLYPSTQYTYSGNYNDLTAPPASSEASGSLAMMPNSPANNGSFATYQDSHSSGPGM